MEEEFIQAGKARVVLVTLCGDESVYPGAAAVEAQRR